MIEWIVCRSNTDPGHDAHVVEDRERFSEPSVRLAAMLARAICAHAADDGSVARDRLDDVSRADRQPRSKSPWWYASYAALTMTSARNAATPMLDVGVDCPRRPAPDARAAIQHRLPCERSRGVRAQARGRRRRRARSPNPQRRADCRARHANWGRHVTSSGPEQKRADPLRERQRSARRACAGARRSRRRVELFERVLAQRLEQLVPGAALVVLDAQHRLRHELAERVEHVERAPRSSLVADRLRPRSRRSSGEHAEPVEDAARRLRRATSTTSRPWHAASGDAPPLGAGRRSAAGTVRRAGRRSPRVTSRRHAPPPARSRAVSRRAAGRSRRPASRRARSATNAGSTARA